MKISEAARILGVSDKKIRDWQAGGSFPRPIPDDYLNHVIEFRLRLEQTMRRRVDAQRSARAVEDAE